MTDLWKKLKYASKPILLYGMGNGADKIIDILDALDIPVSGVFASDGFVRKKSFRGFEVQSYGDAKRKFGDFIVLTAFGTSLPDVMDNMKRIAKEQELYAPDLPVIGEGLFDADYCLQNKDKLEFVRRHLADDTSLQTFDSLIEYKLTGDIKPLVTCESTVEEAYKNILKLTDDETYLDLGAYRGDTVSEFMRYTNGYKKIYAVEPDPKTFTKLQLAVPKDTVCLNKAIADKCGIAHFDVQKGRSSRLDENGTVIHTVSVDNILKGTPATYIKMDVEGAEKLAIEGAVNTIKTYKPKLNVAAYHKAEDIFALPLQILNIRPDYKVYLRHFPYIPAWDTNYYFV